MIDTLLEEHCTGYCVNHYIPEDFKFVADAAFQDLEVGEYDLLSVMLIFNAMRSYLLSFKTE